MPILKLTAAELSTIDNALKVAGDRYSQDVTDLRNVAYSEGERVSPTNERLARQLEKQTRETRALFADLDSRALPDEPMSLCHGSARLRRSLERAIARRVLNDLDAAGFNVVSVDDGGDELVSCDGVDAAIDAVFEVDDATVYFLPADTEPGKALRSWVRFIGGNGEDFVSDYSAGNEKFASVVSAACDAVDSAQVVL